LVDTYLKELKNNSKKLQFYISLKVAKIFSKFPFYINTGADWRGRIYSKSFFLSYQGDDFSSSLLNFHYGESLTATGKKYLYIFGANCYNINNLSKQSYNERIQWVKDNYDNIIKMEPSFILKADSKFLFVAFCLCLKELNSNPKQIIKLPIYLDATCSGIQHLAALMRDFETGSKVNLIPQKESDKVEDIYSFLINPINEAIRKFATENKDFQILKDIKLERVHIKPPVMTKTYNVSVRGIAQQLKSKMKIKKISKNENHYYAPGNNGPILISYLDIFKIAEIINNQIFISFPSLKEIYEYFKDMIKFMSKFNIPMTWFTPSGMQITQYYNVSKQNKISIKFGKGSKTIVLRKKSPNLNKRKQIQGIIPNIIHSLDASHLINLINTAISNNFSPVITNHDCFATHPNKLEELCFLVKKEFIFLYTKSGYLDVFEKRIIQSIKDNNFEVFTEKDGKLYIKPHRTKYYIPIAPKLGNLDIEKILESKYMIT
jgi:Autographiviridae RNA polymerase